MSYRRDKIIEEMLALLATKEEQDTYAATFQKSKGASVAYALRKIRDKVYQLKQSPNPIVCERCKEEIKPRELKINDWRDKLIEPKIEEKHQILHPLDW